MKDCVEVNGKLHDLAVVVLGKQSVVPLDWGAWWVCLDISEKRKTSCCCWDSNLSLCNP
jgi:hypothetical protein